jgi:hypothetical protein
VYVWLPALLLMLQLNCTVPCTLTKAMCRHACSSSPACPHLSCNRKLLQGRHSLLVLLLQTAEQPNRQLQALLNVLSWLCWGGCAVQHHSTG